jgi:hypothetical protein
MADSETATTKQAILPTSGRNVEPRALKSIREWCEEGLTFRNATLRLKIGKRKESGKDINA